MEEVDDGGEVRHRSFAVESILDGLPLSGGR
jgi:hypothetical protein